MKKEQVILGVKIRSESAEKRLAGHLEFQADRYDSYTIIEDDYESEQDLLSLVH